MNNSRIDTEDLVEGFSRRARRKGADIGSMQLATFHASYSRLSHLRGTVGRMPASPQSLRAKVSRFLVLIVQRMLFWYTPQLNKVQDATAETLQEMGRVLLPLVVNQSRLSQPAAGIDDSTVYSDQENLADSGLRRTGRHPELSGKFLFALQDAFRGSREETAQKLSSHLDRILRARPGITGGKWLDIGCGRGEWLELVHERGGSIEGIDSSPLAVKLCRSLGLSASQYDALTYLKGRASESFSVVSLFHVVEHLELASMVEIITEVRRVLTPDGLLLLETPNPGSLTTMTGAFWCDPTHWKPVPLTLAVFVLEYLGFSVESCAGVNETAADYDFARAIESLSVGRSQGLFRRPPDGEDSAKLVEFLLDLEKRVHGPQDYFVLAAPADELK